MDTDLNALLDKALETLTPQQKRVFDMSRKDMKSHKEIADSLGISVYTVQQHISTALKVIRAFLAKYAETYEATALKTHLPFIHIPDRHRTGLSDPRRVVPVQVAGEAQAFVDLFPKSRTGVSLMHFLEMGG